MPANAQHIAVLRVVVREDFNRSLAERLVSHIDQVMKETDSLPSRVAVQASRIVTVDETQDNMDGKKTVKKSSREIQEEVTLYWRRLASEKRTGAC
jgi:glutamate decarboxylase